MAVGAALQGRRVEGDGWTDLKFPGDYVLIHEGGGRVLWAILPDGSAARLPAEDHPEGKGWTITEEGAGSITVSPSIFSDPPNGWHGYLEHGVWREV